MKPKTHTPLILLIGLLFHLNTQSQLKLRHYWLAAPAMLISGMLDGTVESITWHYDDGFKLRCPNVNEQFWNPAKSWKNKYKNHDPAQGPKFFGSTNMFVFTTDAYHLLRATSRTISGVTLGYYIHTSCHEKVLTKRQKWLRIGADFLVLTAIRSAGFHLTYSLLFRKQ